METTQIKPFVLYTLRQKYIDKNGGIYEIVNNLDKKQKYEKYLAKLINKNIKWTSKRIKSLE
jgi:hypothetical protein